jgi:hypothetical protein
MKTWKVLLKGGETWVFHRTEPAGAEAWEHPENEPGDCRVCGRRLRVERPTEGLPDVRDAGD